MRRVVDAQFAALSEDFVVWNAAGWRPRTLRTEDERVLQSCVRAWLEGEAATASFQPPPVQVTA